MKLTTKLMHQWQLLYKKCNWYDFTFIKLFVEDDRMFSKVYLEVWLLGFGLELCLHYRKNYKGQELADKIRGWQGFVRRMKDDRDN